MARLFSGWGAAVIDADVLAREVVAPGTPGLAEIAARWPHVVTVEGSLDRAALSRIVFADNAAREALTAIIHPRVRAAADAREALLGSSSVIVHEVPLLFEGEYWRSCAANVVVVAPARMRIERVMARDGISAEAVQARMAAQIDPAKALGMADFAIHNDTDLPTLEERARQVYVALRRRSAA